MDYAEACSLQSSGEWNALNNTTSQSFGLYNYYTPYNALYVVSVAGNTNLNGNATWNVGDFAYSNGYMWQRIESLSGGGGSAATVAFAPTIANAAANVQQAINNTDNQMVVIFTASTDIPAGKWVYVISGTNQVGLANNLSAATSKVLGISLNAALTGQPITIRAIGVASNVAWTWAQGANLWLSDTSGGVTNVRPINGKYETILGQALTPTTIDINIVYNGLRSF